MDDKLQLYNHQIEALKWVADKPKALLCLDCGLGKTLISILTIKQNERVLMVVPCHLKINWFKEIKRFLPFDMSVKIVKNRKDSLAKEGISIINYDILGKRVKKKITPSFNFKGFDRVILDESQYIANPKSIRSKIAGKIVKNVKNAVLLSATPMSRPIQIYTSLICLGILDMKYHDFGMKFCDGKKIYLGRKEVFMYRGLSNEKELRDIIHDKTIVMKKQDVIDLPDKTYKVISLDLPISKQEKEYDLQDILEDPRPIGFEGLSSLLQMQGVMKTPQSVDFIKMRLETIDKIVVFAKHKEVIDLLMENLVKYKPVKIDGRCSTVKKDKAVVSFQEDKDTRLMIANITAGGVGITLTASSHIIFVEPDWNFNMIDQCASRCHRIGAKNNVLIELLVISNSIDEKVLHTSLVKNKYTRSLGL